MREKNDLKSLSLYEKARLVNGVGSWKTFDCDGKTDYFVMSDGPHGLRKQDVEDYADMNNSNIATCFPTAASVACSFNRDTVKKMAKAIAHEAISEKVDVVLGCGTNIKRSPLCGRNFEYFSEDPFLAGTCATSYISAMEEEGVGTSLKHFACNNQETHRQTSNSQVDEKAMFEIYLKPFEMAVKNANPTTIMASYNMINDTYACANKYLLTDILRKKWGFKGLVVSDWGATMNVIDCLKAGMDLEMPDCYGHHTKRIVEAVNNGELKEEELDRAVINVLNTAKKCADRRRELKVDLSEHNKIACEIECDSAVLLKNTGVLPIKKDEKILIVGELAANMRYQGAGSSHINTIPTLNLVDALIQAGYNVAYKKGYHSMTEKTDEKVAAEAVEGAGNYDKILYCCGLTDITESEGYDRQHMSLAYNQLALLKQLCILNKNIAVITFGGSPFEMPFADEVKDILMMYLGGQAVGEACAKLVTGEVNPSGKLAETYPFFLKDVPNSSYYGKKLNDVPYLESIFVGYRYYETFDVPVRFEFGFGLSYTKFTYSDLNVTLIGQNKYRVSYKITNVGDVYGGEISQVYVVNPKDNLLRPSIELKGFDKTYLNPGETKEVNVELNADAFSIYDTARHDFAVPEGNYMIAVGASVRDIRLKTGIYVEGERIERDERVMYREYFAAIAPTFTREAFSKLYGREFTNHDYKLKGDYTVYDSFEEVSSKSLFGRVLFKTVCLALRLSAKTSKDDPAFKMIMTSMAESPLDSLLSTSNGIIKPNLTECLVLKANGRGFKGFMRLFKK